MSVPKIIDRKSFLSSAVATWAALALSGCDDDGDTGGTGGTNGGGTGGTGGTRAEGGTGTGGSSAGEGAEAGESNASGGAGSAGRNGDAGAGEAGTPPNQAGASGRAGEAGAPEAGHSGEGGSDGGVSGGGIGGTAGGGTSGGGTGGDGTGGDGGGTYTCVTNTDNGDHSHPLVVPGEDVLDFAEHSYILEDGGTGHTHTVALTAYDYIFLQDGSTVTAISSETEGHSHDCEITCSD